MRVWGSTNSNFSHSGGKPLSAWMYLRATCDDCLALVPISWDGGGAEGAHHRILAVEHVINCSNGGPWRAGDPYSRFPRPNVRLALDD